MLKNEETYCVVYHKIVRELGAWEAVVYSTIANLLRKTDGIGEVSNQTLMEMLGKDKKSIYRWIATLIEAGYIEKRAGDGRGNISIYYITKKGGNLTPFKEKKGWQFDTERVAKSTIKGGNLPPINKGENKEKNKESGGDTRDTRDPHALSDTTPQIFEEKVFNPKNENTMKDFEEFWELFPGHENWSGEKESSERVWFATPQEWRDKLIQQLRSGQRWRVRENDNPYWYLKNYNGETVQVELPYLRQGTVKFQRWHQENTIKGNRMCLLRFEDRVAYCLHSDLQTMLNAGAQLINDNWR